MADMTRNEARRIWASSGLVYADLTAAALEDLRRRIGVSLKASGLIAGYRASRKRPKIYEGRSGLRAAEIFCSAYYFDHREAVTFNDGGFVGFAGWASEENVQPILAAFVEWVGDRVKIRERALVDVCGGGDRG